jgi:hypothetical protein
VTEADLDKMIAETPAASDSEVDRLIADTPAAPAKPEEPGFMEAVAQNAYGAMGAITDPPAAVGRALAWKIRDGDSRAFGDLLAEADRSIKSERERATAAHTTTLDIPIVGKVPVSGAAMIGQAIGSIPAAFVAAAKIGAPATTLAERIMQGTKVGTAVAAAAAPSKTPERLADLPGYVAETGQRLALGALGGSLAPASPVGAAASPARTEVADWLRRKAGERNIKAAGAIQSDITRARKQVGREGLVEIGAEMGDNGITSFLAGPEKVYERAGKAMDAAGQEMRDALAAADKDPAALTTVGDLVTRARNDVSATLRANPHTAKQAATLDELLDGYLTTYGGPNAPLTPSKLHEIRRNISDDLYGWRGTQDPGANAMKGALHDFRSVASDELNQAIDRAGAGSQQWRAANRKFEVAARAEEFADKGMDRAHGNNMVSLTEMMAGLGAFAGGNAAGGADLGAGAALATLGAALARRRGSAMLGTLEGKLSNALRPSAAGVTSPGATIRAGVQGGEVAAAARDAAPQFGLAPAAAEHAEAAAPASGAQAQPGSANEAPGQDSDDGAARLDPVEHIERTLQADPSALGAYAAPMAARFKMGGRPALSQWHFVESQRNPEYRALVERLTGEKRAR